MDQYQVQGQDQGQDGAFWSAVQNRDARYDGQFFYGVRTTGVFCKPSCKSKMARRENVLFFPTLQAAEAAGFRACKKCSPSAESPRIHEVVYAFAARARERGGGGEEGRRGRENRFQRIPYSKIIRHANWVQSEKLPR